MKTLRTWSDMILDVHIVGGGDDIQRLKKSTFDICKLCLWKESGIQSSLGRHGGI